MRFSFSIKVPLRERLRILWRGGLFVRIDYNGQHATTRATFDAIPAKHVTGKTTKEK